MQHLESSSFAFHDFQFWGIFLEHLSHYLGIVRLAFVKIKYRHRCPETVHIHRFHLYWLSLENFRFESLKKVRSEFGTFRNSHSSWIYNLWYLYGWIRMEKWSNFHVCIFHFCWEMSKLQESWLEVEDEFIFRTWLVLCIVCFAYVNGCTSTTVA